VDYRGLVERLNLPSGWTAPTALAYEGIRASADANEARRLADARTTLERALGSGLLQRSMAQDEGLSWASALGAAHDRTAGALRARYNARNHVVAADAP
jgi:hypothetical protein